MKRKDLESALKAQNPELTASEIDGIIENATNDFDERLSERDLSYLLDNFCSDHFGLEPDYLDYFLNRL